MEDREANRLLVATPDGIELLPEWLLAEIADERRRIARRAAQGELPSEEAIGDAETLAYLHTLSLRAPMPRVLIRVFEHLTREVLRRRRPDEPPPIRGAELTAGERDALRRLKAELSRKRGKVSVSGFDPESRPRLKLARAAPKL